MTEVKEGWRDGFEDGEREELDKGWNISWLTPFQGLGYVIYLSILLYMQMEGRLL
jgi:hypothetical protein